MGTDHKTGIRRMNRRVFAGAMVLAVSVASAPAQASPPEPASGSWSVTAITGFSLSQAGANLVIRQTTEGVVTGTLSGTFTDEISAVLHPNGKATAQGTLTCVCTVGDRSGAIKLVQVSTGDIPSQTLSGTATITGGIGDLADLRGTFDLEGAVDPNGLATITYDGRIHVDH